MQTQMPFFEVPEDALKACISALGGAKAVAPDMWPDKTIENARDYLLACLNPERNEKLSYTQIIHIFKMAKSAGFHGGFDWLAGACGYKAAPISIEQQRDVAARLVADTAEKLQAAVDLLKSLDCQS